MTFGSFFTLFPTTVIKYTRMHNSKLVDKFEMTTRKFESGKLGLNEFLSLL